MLVHDIARTPVSIVAKYDLYDPNTNIAGDTVGVDETTNEFDLAQSTLGVGALWNLNPAIRLTAYYEFNKNEMSKNLTDWSKDSNNDIFTLRMQYKF